MALGWRKQYLRYKGFFLNILAIYGRREDVRSFLGIILSLITVSIFSIFALKPTILTILSLLKEIKTKQQVTTQMDNKIQNLSKAQALLDQDAPSLSLIKQAVPTSPSLEVFVRQIETSAHSRSVSLVGMSVGEVTLIGKEKPGKEEPKEIPEGARGMTFSLSVSSPTYPSLSSFLQDLENLRRPVNIEVAGVSVFQTESGGTLTLVVSGVTIFSEAESQLVTR